MAGKLDGNKVFKWLISAGLVKVNKEQRGVGMRNMKYAPAYDEFVQILHLHKPSAHTFFSDYLVQRLKHLDYTGPTCLSCEDTKLLSGLHLHWNSKEKAHYLVGAVGGPIFVPNIDNLQALMTDPTIVEGKRYVLFCDDKEC